MQPSETARRAGAPDSARILILDYGSQYTQLIARRVREAGVYSEIHAPEIAPDRLAAFGASGIILSGGPESVGAENAPTVSDAVAESGVPLLGICYGMQALAAKFGGAVLASPHREFGYAEVSLASGDGLRDELLGGLAGDGDRLKVWMSHGDRVETLPDGFERIASTENAPLAGMADPRRRIYGLQFHPEVTHTEHGQAIVERFVRGICGCPNRWTPGNIVAEHIGRVRREVGGERVLLGLSGGVDSSVVAALLHAAIGDQLVCVFVDHGLLRLDEGDQVMATFRESLGANVVRVNAEEAFLDALRGVADPEEKRKIIGRKFIEVFEDQANKLAGVRWLAQGTIYPDVIESAGASTGGKAHVIKSHHNVGGLPERMRLRLIEPLRSLFKDEVRKIGLELGLPPKLVGRHPFPGPGLGVRILGPVKNGIRRHAAAGRPHFHRRTRRAGTLRPGKSGVRRVPAGQVCGRDGRRAALRLRDRAARGGNRRLHDGPLGAVALRLPRSCLAADHQRGARHFTGHL